MDSQIIEIAASLSPDGQGTVDKSLADLLAAILLHWVLFFFNGYELLANCEARLKIALQT